MTRESDERPSASPHERLDRRRVKNAVFTLRTGENGQLVPFEIRKWQIMANAIRLWNEKPVSRYEGPALLLAAETVDPIWDRIPAHRGWAGSLPDLEVVRVGGDHLSLVEEPFTSAVARELMGFVRRVGLEANRLRESEKQGDQKAPTRIT